MRERSFTCDARIEGYFDPQETGDHRVEIRQLLQAVTGDKVRGGKVEPRDQPGERCYAVALADAEYRGVDIGGTRLESGKRVGDGAAAVVVPVKLDPAADRVANISHKPLDLTRCRHPDRVGDPYAVDAKRVDGPVDVEQIGALGAQRILAGEAHLHARCLEHTDNDSGLVDDLRERAAVAVFAQQLRGAEQQIDAVDAAVDSMAGVLDCAAGMR